jgi:hypothetical protein
MLVKDPRQRATMREVLRSQALQTPGSHSSLDRLVGVNSKVKMFTDKIRKITKKSIISVSITKRDPNAKFPSSKYIAEPKDQPFTLPFLGFNAGK